MYLKRNFTYLVLCGTDIVYCCICYMYVYNIFAISMNIFWIYVLLRGFFFFEHLCSRTRGRVQREGTMRVRRTKQLKWDEVQDTVCSSRRNFAHVPLSRSLQPGKGRMAGKSRTVEVRFYKESRVLGCDGIRGSRCLLNICISRCRWKNIHRCI